MRLPAPLLWTQAEPFHFRMLKELPTGVHPMIQASPLPLRAISRAQPGSFSQRSYRVWTATLSSLVSFRLVAGGEGRLGSITAVGAEEWPNPSECPISCTMTVSRSNVLPPIEKLH